MSANTATSRIENKYWATRMNSVIAALDLNCAYAMDPLGRWTIIAYCLDRSVYTPRGSVQVGFDEIPEEMPWHLCVFQDMEYIG